MSTVIANSTFLDAFGAGLSTQQQYQTLATGSEASARAVLQDLFQYGQYHASAPSEGGNVVVGLVLDRATDSGGLLSGNWAQRQAALHQFSDSSALWQTYGANSGTYNAVQN